MVRRTMVLCGAAALAAGVFASRAEACGCGEKGTVTGTVLVACPQGRLLKLKADCPGCEEGCTFGVVAKAREEVKALKEGDRVEVTYVRCPKSKKLMVTSVKKL